MNNQAALARFVTRKAEIDTILARLVELSADHFNHNPDEIHWGHVGDLDLILSRLNEIAETFALQEKAAKS